MSLVNTELVLLSEERFRNQSTVDEVYESPALLQATRDGKLTNYQRGIVAVVVSIMQDRMINCYRETVDILEKELQEQRSSLAQMSQAFTSGSLSLLQNAWQAPMFFVGGSPSREGGDDSGTHKTNKIASWLTWGNFSAMAAIVLLCVATFYTKAYSSWKERAEGQAGYVVDLEKERDSLRENVDRLTAEVGEANSKAEEIGTQLTVAKAAAETARQLADDMKESVGDAKVNEQLESQLKTTTADLHDQIAKTAKAEERAKKSDHNAATYKNLWETEKRNASKAGERAKALNAENMDLKRQLQNLQGYYRTPRRNR